MSASIILIKTACGDLDFLVPVVDKLVEAIGSGMDYVRIQNADDIDSVLDRMRNSNYTRVIIFSHGREKELLGADLPLSGEHGPVWLNSSDQLAVLADKEIFCLACQSQSLGGAAIESGANAFLGFAEVPFHRFEGDEPRREPQ